MRHDRAMMPELTGSYLGMLFSYNPEDGLFRHKTYRGPRTGGPGSVAGHRMANGYITIKACKQPVLAHRLAWLWMTGKWPEHEIDHINGIRDDNKFSNLREATRTQQAQNGGIRRSNTSGAAGVCFDKSRNKWLARIDVNGKPKHLGRFALFEDAVKARYDAEKKYFGEYRAMKRQGWNPA